MKTKLVAALICLASMPAANAGVIYRWTDTTINPVVGRMTGVIEISTASWESGASLSGWYSGGIGPQPIPGMERFFLSGEFIAFTVDYRSATPPGIGTYGFDVTMASPLSGSRIGFNTGFDSTWMTPTSGGTWIVENFSSDSPGPCYVNTGEACLGQTGKWVLDTSTLPVPEPATWALWAAGLALIAARRRQA